MLAEPLRAAEQLCVVAPVRASALAVWEVRFLAGQANLLAIAAAVTVAGDTLKGELCAKPWCAGEAPSITPVPNLAPQGQQQVCEPLRQ